MAKHSVPKYKKSKPRSALRYGAFKTRALKQLSNAVNLMKCHDCGAKKIVHMVCHECGKYNGRQVINKQKEIEKITKIKA
ncbi:50S ribosomal protein L32 [Candidatus Peregrinibacteria bacterium]|nr:50S ribosomal protein L32 [Candidatus Peregrinibacteria bacterium]